MKKLGFTWITALAAGIVLFSASSCSSDESGETQYITNPSLTDKIVKAGETGNITFTATGNWTLSNDSPEWLELSSSTGGSGDQTVSYEIKDSNLEFDQQDQAKITLTLGDKPFSCIFTREAKERTATFKDDPLNPTVVTACTVQDLAGDGKFKGRLIVETNFEWTLVSSPDWVKPVVELEEGETEQDAVMEGLYPTDPSGKPIITDKITHTVFFDLRDEHFTTTGNEGELVFAAKANRDFQITLPIKFFGAEPSYVTYEGLFQVKFTADGFVYESTSIGGTTPTDKKETPFSVKSIPGGYKTVFVEFNNNFARIMQPETEWFKPWVGIKSVVAAPESRALFEIQHFTMSVQDNVPAWEGGPAPKERKAEMYLLPATVYSQFNDIGTELFSEDGTAVAEEYQQYLACMITQEAPKAGISIKMADNSFLEQFPVDEGTTKFESFFYSAAADVTEYTAIVTLSDELAGCLPQVLRQDGTTESPNWVVESTMSANGDVMTIPIASFGEGISNEANATITLQNLSDDAKSYELKFSLPANTLDTPRMLHDRKIDFYDADGVLVANFNIEQQAKL